MDFNDIVNVLAAYNKGLITADDALTNCKVFLNGDGEVMRNFDDTLADRAFDMEMDGVFTQLKRGLLTNEEAYDQILMAQDHHAEACDCEDDTYDDLPDALAKAEHDVQFLRQAIDGKTLMEAWMDNLSKDSLEAVTAYILYLCEDD